MIQANINYYDVPATLGTICNIVDATQDTRFFYFTNLDKVNTITLKFQQSTDGGNTWNDIQGAEIVLDPEETKSFSITNANLLRIVGSGNAQLLVVLVRNFAPNAVTIVL